MKIYLVTLDLQDSPDIIKGFISKTKANNYCKKLNKKINSDYFVNEIEVEEWKFVLNAVL